MESEPSGWEANADGRLASIAQHISKNNEDARLLGAAMAGSLLGVWTMGFLIEIGYEQLTAAGIITVGVLAGIGLNVFYARRQES